MIKVYICSPYSGDVRRNVRYALNWSKDAYKLGYLPICVHIYLEKATGLDEFDGDREELLRLGREFVLICDELWICSPRITHGMRKEIEYAIENKIKVREIYKEKL